MTNLLPDPVAPALSRPLGLHTGHAYAAAWPHLQPARTDNDEAAAHPRAGLVLVRDDGLLWLPQDTQPADWAGCPHPGLPAVPPLPASRLWSTAGLRCYTAGQRASPRIVFDRLVETFDRFMDFTGSLAPQTNTAEFLAVYVLATWFLPAFNTFPALWIMGDHGSGKSRLLHLLARVAHLGLVVAPSTPGRALRDLAGLGAALAVDDADRLFPVRSHPTPAEARGLGAQRDVFLAGARRGVTFALPSGGAAGLCHVDVFGPRLFTTTRSAPPSAAIGLPLVRSADPARSAFDPDDPGQWPRAPRELVDDLWALSLAHLPQFLSTAPEGLHRGSLSGPAFALWRPLLLTAAWLTQATGLGYLYQHVVNVALAHEPPGFSPHVLQTTRVVLHALYSFVGADLANWIMQVLRSPDPATREMMKAGLPTDSFAARLRQHLVNFSASSISACAGHLGDYPGLESYGGRLSPVLIGHVLGQLRIPQSRPHGGRCYTLSLEQLEPLLAAYDLPSPPSPLTHYEAYQALIARLFPSKPLG